MAITYDNTKDPVKTNDRSLNSRLFLNNAFILLGDFSYSPFYGTLGQMFVPFGTYSSTMISSPLTKSLMRTKARAVLAGYQQQAANAFYTAVYVFKGDSHGSAGSRINNGGVNVGYRFDLATPDVAGDFGAGLIGNMADSVGMQYTNNRPQFNGFGGPSPYGNEKIVHRVPALNVRGKFSLGDHLDVITEYVGATTSFNPNDLSFNVNGAKPWGMNAEAAYSFSCFEKPSAVGVGFSQIKEALALGLPERRFGLVFNTSLWRNTLQAIEFRHDINYASSNTSSGSGVAYVGTGTVDNIVTAEFEVYF